MAKNSNPFAYDLSIFLYQTPPVRGVSQCTITSSARFPSGEVNSISS